MKKMIFVSILVVILLLICGAASSISIKKDKFLFINSTSQNAQWTIMVYLDGDNDLESYGIDDFNEMAEIGSTNNVNIVVQFDRVYSYDYSYDDWTSTKRFFVTKYMSPTSSNAIMDLGEANMGDPQTLIDFATWAMSSYPANNYCLILWDHGTGWKGKSKGDSKGVCEDFTDYDQLTTAELDYAFKMITGNGVNKLEIIGFDACLMGMIEVAYELENYGMYMVASEEEEPLDGWNYNGSLGELVKNPSMYPKQLGEAFVNTYYGYQITLSTIDLGQLYTLVEAVDDFSNSLMNSDIYRPVVDYASQKVELFMNKDFSVQSMDLYHFAELNKKYTEDIDIQNSAQNVMNKVNLVITSEKHDFYHEDAHGISIYLPHYGFDPDYSYLRFAKDTDWDEMINWLLTLPNSRSPSKPTIDGPNTGQTNTGLTYEFISEDFDDDLIYYFIDWGYNDETSFIGPSKSGKTESETNSWYFSGGYVIGVMAIDEYGASSEWGYLTISVPKLKPFTNPILNKLRFSPSRFRLLNLF